MKTILLLLLTSTFTFAKMDLRNLDLVQLKKDKVFVLQQEMKKIQKLAGAENFSTNKSMNSDCGDIDIDININTNNNDDNDSSGTSAYCSARWLDGTCRTWGSDQVGTCYPYCERRWSDGECRTWGADICD